MYEMTLKRAGFGEIDKNVIMDNLSVRGHQEGGLGRLSRKMLGMELRA